MLDELRDNFVAFLRLAEQALRSEAHVVHRGGLRLVRGSAASLRERVENLEARPEFLALCHAIERGLNAGGFGSYRWKSAVGNWLRRSGLYHRVAAGEALPEIDNLLENLLAELSRR